MKLNRAAATILGITVVCLSGPGHAQKADFGKQEYDGYCAVCHGKLGKGDGPYASMIGTPIPDLTTLSVRNGGVYPFQRVTELVDGRQSVKAHGPRDMPIWGARYMVAAGEVSMDGPYSPDIYVRSRILALTEYVSRLQAK